MDMHADFDLFDSNSVDTQASSSGLSSQVSCSPSASPTPESDIMSPGLPTDSPASAKSDKFFLLRGDSERRETLVHVLGEDQESVSV